MIGLIGLNSMAQKGQIEFTGSSLMQQFPIGEMTMTADLPVKIYNRAVKGYKTQDLIENIGPLVLGIEPSKIFINIGTNDLADERITDDQLIANYKAIIDAVHDRLPKTKVYMMAYYLVNEDGGSGQPPYPHFFDLQNNEAIDATNGELSVLAGEWGANGSMPTTACVMPKGSFAGSLPLMVPTCMPTHTESFLRTFSRICLCESERE